MNTWTATRWAATRYWFVSIMSLSLAFSSCSLWNANVKSSRSRVHMCQLKIVWWNDIRRSFTWSNTLTDTFIVPSYSPSTQREKVHLCMCIQVTVISVSVKLYFKQYWKLIASLCNNTCGTLCLSMRVYAFVCGVTVVALECTPLHTCTLVLLEHCLPASSSRGV